MHVRFETKGTESQLLPPLSLSLRLALAAAVKEKVPWNNIQYDVIHGDDHRDPANHTATQVFMGQLVGIAPRWIYLVFFIYTCI